MIAIALGLLLQQAPPGEVPAFLRKHCLDCHEGPEAKGHPDLSTLAFAPEDPKSFARWVAVHDRVRDGEMPPAKKAQPAREARDAFLASLAAPLVEADRAREDREGRSTWRRLNRVEIENSLRDLLGAPWLQIRSILPEDGEAHRFNKSGDALDISHVQMSQFLQAAEYALRSVLADQVRRPVSEIHRHHTRDMPSFSRKMFYNEFNRSPERATFPVLGFAGQPEVRSGKQPISVGPADPAVRELEALGVVAGAYEPLEPKFNLFKAPRSGRYRLRLNGLSVWVGPEKDKWWRPDLNVVSRGRRSEPVTIYAELPPRQLVASGPWISIPIPPSRNSTSSCSRARRSARTRAVSSARGRPTGTTPLPRRTASRAWPTAGSRSRARSSRTGLPRATVSSSATCPCARRRGASR